jgi:hypothetical protein
MALQRVIGAAVDDELRELRREKAPQAADALELADLLGDSPLQRSVPLLHFGGKRLDRSPGRRGGQEGVSSNGMGGWDGIRVSIHMGG